jgi:hypothetical protein
MVQDVDGLPGSLTASSSVPDTSPFGSGDGSVSLSGTIGAPILSASAVSDTGARVNTNALALQQYTYTGLSTSTRTFEATFDYTQTLPGGPYLVMNGVTASIEIFTLPGGFEAGTTAQSNADALFNPSTQAGFTLLSSATFSDVNTNLSGVGTLAATATLNPGESFFVWVILQTPALNGGVINVGTLNTQWNDSANLVPANIAAVPEPTTLALLGIGIAGLGFTRRRTLR